MIITRAYLEKFQSDVADEVWKVHPFEDRLSVSSYGNVKRNEQVVEYYRGSTLVKRHLDEHIYPVIIGTGGYLIVGHPYASSSYVHRLVGETFLIDSQLSDNMEVDHIDDNRANPYVSNLQWLTRAKNIQKAIPHMLDSNLAKARSLVDLSSGKVYQSVSILAQSFPDYVENSKSVECYIRNNLKRFGGYLPKYNTVVRYIDDSPIQDMDKHISDMLREMLKSISKKDCVHFIEDDIYFPSCRYADDYFNLSYGMTSESIKNGRSVCRGKYHLEYVRWEDVPDEAILKMKDYMINITLSLKGNGKGNVM